MNKNSLLLLNAGIFFAGQLIIFFIMKNSPPSVGLDFFSGLVKALYLELGLAVLILLFSFVIYFFNYESTSKSEDWIFLLRALAAPLFFLLLFFMLNPVFYFLFIAGPTALSILVVISLKWHLKPKKSLKFFKFNSVAAYILLSISLLILLISILFTIFGVN